MNVFSGTFPAYESPFLKTQQTSNTYTTTFIHIRGDLTQKKKRKQELGLTYC